MSSLKPDSAFDRLADTAESRHTEKRAASRLKARLYTALVQQQTQTGPLRSLPETRKAGRGLCVFEQLVQISPVGQAAQSVFYCKVCHARVLAERFENPPIYWSNCPYADFKKS